MLSNVITLFYEIYYVISVVIFMLSVLPHGLVLI